jgi:hypothetical protein
MGKNRSQALAALPWRDPNGERPGLPLPPARMPIRFAGNWRKRWRYVAAFSDEFMICAAGVRVGPARQTFWAVLDRSNGELLTETKQPLPFERGEVWSEMPEGQWWEIGSDLTGVRTRIDAGEVQVKVRIGEGVWAECVCPNGEGGYVWTRKRASTMKVDLHLPSGRVEKGMEMRGIEDESAGYHPRQTSWSWSAGVGHAGDGREVAWNLVEGVNDPPEHSERAIWVAGEELPREPAPVSFDGLDAVAFADGSRLEFKAEAERRAEENKWIVKSSYRQPFGTFSGSLDGIPIADGIGVMESHEATW